MQCYPRVTAQCRIRDTAGKDRCDTRSNDPSPTSIGFRLHTFFKGTDTQMFCIHHVHEVDIGTHGCKIRVVAQCPALLVHRHLRKIACNKANPVTGAGVEVPIPIGQGLPLANIRHLQADRHAGQCLIVFYYFCRMQTVRRFKGKRGIAQPSRECHHATSPVPTHHSTAAIRVVKDHLEVCRPAFFQQHKAIRPKAITTVTQFSNHARSQRIIGSRPVIGYQEIVPGTLVFIKTHRLPILIHNLLVSTTNLKNNPYF